MGEWRMINLKEVTPMDVMPVALRGDAALEAAGFALHETARMLMDMVDRTSVYSMVDTLPEKIVDLLAIEFRAQYYEKDMPLEEKRGGVKNALLWYRKAGTVSAVLGLCELLYGKSMVTEWFRYGGRPYTFRVEILEEGRPVDATDIDNFARAVGKVKNTRSLMEAMVFHRKTDTTLHTGVAVSGTMRNAIVDFYTEHNRRDIMRHTASRPSTAYKREPVVDFARETVETRGRAMSGVAVATARTQKIMGV